tara:strand:- start:3423 stop:3611 length:189 start_codon:yes stop_codon:yes gene_type:complete
VGLIHSSLSNAKKQPYLVLEASVRYMAFPNGENLKAAFDQLSLVSEVSSLVRLELLVPESGV